LPATKLPVLTTPRAAKTSTTAIPAKNKVLTADLGFGCGVGVNGCRDKEISFFGLRAL
jgi:hypothetical protein